MEVLFKKILFETQHEGLIRWEEMSKKSKFIIITTINKPSESIIEFCNWSEWQVVVVGDRKTPTDWKCGNAIFLSLEKQYDDFREFAKVIPENTYVRKMLGYVYAIKHGATAIFETDDDNIPYPDTEREIIELIQASDRVTGERRRRNDHWLNAYELFGASNCWPRGFPLEFVKQLASETGVGTDNKPWAITQFLADDDPDVDAIYRMIIGRSVYFAKGRRFIFDEGTYCPINSQATLWLPEAFPLLFLPTGIADRVTDILRGYIASACLWKAGYSVSFASPIVFQKRNYHNLNNDFLQEIPLYLNAVKWCQSLLQIDNTNIIDCYRSAIRILCKNKAISENNLFIYDMFLSSAGLTI
jgi:hypothetical protein